MSLRTFKARPKPNLDLTNKRRPLTDQKNNEEIQNKTECTSENTEAADGGVRLAVSVTEANLGGDNENKLSSKETTSSAEVNEEVSGNSCAKSSAQSLAAKLKPRPKPNLAVGSRSNNATISQKSSSNTQPDTEDCVIVSVSYNDVSGHATQQENQVTTSNSADQSADTVKPTSTDIQRSISAKLKSRPKPNLASFNRSKRPLPLEFTTTAVVAAEACNNNNSSELIKQINKDLTNSSTTVNNLTVTPSSSEQDTNKDYAGLKEISIIENEPKNNKNSSFVSKQKIKKKSKKKSKKKRKKKQIKLNTTRELAVRGKLRRLVRALEFLEKIIAKKKKQINLLKAKKELDNSNEVRRKKVLILKRIKRMIRINVMTKQKIKTSAMRIKMNDVLLFSKLLRVVMKEIDKAKKNVVKSKGKLWDEAKVLEKQKPVVVEVEKSQGNCEKIKAAESCTAQSNKDVSDPADKSETTIVLAQNKNKVQKIRCKINPMITKPSGVKSMRIKLFKDDGTSEKTDQDTASSDKNSTESQSSQESSSSPSKDVKTATSHARRFNMNTVKPNLATANRNYKPIQYTTSYGKLNNAVKQKFKDKFGCKKPPEHSKLTMLDLIFYNPSTNPMSEKEKKKDLPNECEISNEDSKQNIKSEEKSVNEKKDVTREEASDDELNDSSRAMDTNGLPVPQLKITADGKVIIAPESLIVPGKNDDALKNESRPLIVENELTHHKVFNKKTKLEKKIWTFQETLKFYKILNETGSDFLSMASHFPDRTRNCLKRKFKREEKINGELIDKVIGSRRIDFSHVEKELALNQMWDEVEKSCKRRSKFMPEIPDVNKGSISDMFLTKKEREMKAANGEDVAAKDDTASKNIKQEKNRKTTKKKRKPKVLRLKEYLSDNGSNGNAKKTFQINLKCLAEPESTNVSSDDEEIANDESKSIPIVVNTKIESSGIKYTKSVTFNPGNMDLPVDVNETIAHTGGDQECPSSTAIIQEIVDILSTDERPSILSADSSTFNEDVSESDQSISTESGQVYEESIISNKSECQ